MAMYKNEPGQVWPQPGETVWVIRCGAMPPTRAKATIVSGEVTILAPVLEDGSLDMAGQKHMRPACDGLMQPLRAFYEKQDAVRAWNRHLRQEMQAAKAEYDQKVRALSSRLLDEDGP